VSSLLLLLALAAILVALAYYSFRIEPNWLEVTRIELVLPRLPTTHDGLVVAHLSDLHVGERVSPGLIRRAIDVCNAARPDLVAITGDVTDHGWEIDQAIEELRRLRPRPTYVILGNHDYRVGEGRARALTAALQGLGMVVLRNEAVPYECCGTRLWIVGLDDPCTERDDLAKAQAGLGPDDYPRLLLTHSPQTMAQLPRGEADLALAGHTHGGQIFVPILTGLLLRWFYSRFSHGLYWCHGTALYVNRGLGSLGVPARFLRRPEVTLLTLRSDRAGQIDTRRHGC